MVQPDLPAHAFPQISKEQQKLLLHQMVTTARLFAEQLMESMHDSECSLNEQFIKRFSKTIVRLNELSLRAQSARSKISYLKKLD
jgi:hypothetical protein